MYQYLVRYKNKRTFVYASNDDDAFSKAIEHYHHLPDEKHHLISVERIKPI